MKKHTLSLRATLSALNTLLVGVSLVFPGHGFAQPPATAPAPAELVDKYGVSVALVLKQSFVPAGEQPRVVVRFTNHGDDYMNFNNGKAYCDWRFEFRSISDDPKEHSRWVVRFDTIDIRKPHSIEQAKAGESCETDVNLNDPLFTFKYERVGVDKNDAPKTVEMLPPGKYELTATLAMEPFFIRDPKHMWEGSAITAPVEIDIRDYAPGQEPHKPTEQELAAYSLAIARVTDQLADGHGLWTNGFWYNIKLPDDAAPHDIVASVVNQSTVGSKAFKVLHVLSVPTDPNIPQRTMSAALVQVGKEHKVFIFWPNSRDRRDNPAKEVLGWSARFYDTTLTPPATQPAGARK